MKRPAVLVSLVMVTAIGSIAVAQESVHLNRTIETLADGKPAFGIFSGNFSLANARALATSDLDFIFIDMEHTPYDVETLQTFLLGMTNKQRMLEKGNLQMDVTPLVRIPMNGRENLQWLVKQVLDVGAFGIVFPYVETRAEAENAVSSMRYPQRRGDAAMEPAGTRGASPGIARWFWGASDYFDRADVCKRRNIPCGLTTDAESVARYLEEGYSFVTVGYWNDAGISGDVALALDIAREASGRTE